MVEQYTLMLFVSVVRRAEPGWRPEKVWVRSAGAGWTAEHGLLADAESIRGGPATGIHVPRELLIQPMGRRVLAGGVGDDEVLADSEGFTGRLKHALGPLVGRVPLDIGLAAEIAGASPRTVRLWLHEEGSSWRRLLDEMRFEYSRSRMIRTDAKMADIALELGYTDASHFTRAFRRWTAMTPSEFRSRLRAPRD
ncbi:MAG: helix-turn-helix transcriptional regulator [bacterium]|nr:helix-turn-helix transcriptional regulator [bacterium]